MPRKVDFALAVRGKISQLDKLVADLNELDSIYMNSGYNPSGADPILLSDLDGYDMTPQDLANVSIFIANINLFLNNGQPMQFDYAAKIDAFRNMPNT